MTYLIALIIAIALGAVIALLSFVNIGSGFGNQSAAAKAQQFSQAGSQMEVAMSAYLADNAESAFDTGLSATITNLENSDWIKETPVAPTGTGALELTQGSDNAIYLTLTGNLSDSVCDEINALSGYSKDGTTAGALSIVEGERLACDGTGQSDNFAAFKVE